MSEQVTVPSPNLKRTEEGTRTFFGKEYHWARIDGRLSLQRGPEPTLVELFDKLGEISRNISADDVLDWLTATDPRRQQPAPSEATEKESGA